METLNRRLFESLKDITDMNDIQLEHFCKDVCLEVCERIESHLKLGGGKYDPKKILDNLFTMTEELWVVDFMYIVKPNKYYTSKQYLLKEEDFTLNKEGEITTGFDLNESFLKRVKEDFKDIKIENNFFRLHKARTRNTVNTEFIGDLDVQI